MGKSLDEIAIQLKECNKKVQLIYAFNGTGKTRLSRAFKELIAPKNELEEENGLASKKILYYNAFTEDLFYWDNDLDNDTNLKLKIHPNAFTEWVFVEQGQELNVISNFQEYINNHALTPKFNEDFSEVTFSLKKGNDEDIENIKISKGEESNLNIRSFKIKHCQYPPLRTLYVDMFLRTISHGIIFHRKCSLGLHKTYLEYNSTISISSTGTSIISLVGRFLMVPLKFSTSASIHSGTNLPAVTSRISLYLCMDLALSLISITSPALIR